MSSLWQFSFNEPCSKANSRGWLRRGMTLHTMKQTRPRLHIHIKVANGPTDTATCSVRCPRLEMKLFHRWGVSLERIPTCTSSLALYICLVKSQTGKCTSSIKSSAGTKFQCLHISSRWGKEWGNGKREIFSAKVLTGRFPNLHFGSDFISFCDIDNWSNTPH